MKLVLRVLMHHKMLTVRQILYHVMVFLSNILGFQFLSNLSMNFSMFPNYAVYVKVTLDPSLVNPTLSRGGVFSLVW